MATLLPEETYRKKSLSGKSIIIVMSGTLIDINEALSEGFRLDNFPYQFTVTYSDWDKTWDCYDLYSENDFTNTTIRKVITNIRNCYKAHQIVKKMGKFNVRIK